MLDELKRNGSGYYDPTAYKAIKNMEREENMEMKRGDIWEVQMANGNIAEFLVISATGKPGSVVTVVKLFDGGTIGENDVQIMCRGVKNAPCDTISFSKKENFITYIRTLNDVEQAEVDAKLMKVLALGKTPDPTETVENAVIGDLNALVDKLNEENHRLLMELGDAERKLKDAEKQIPVFPVEIEKELLRAETQRDLYKELYEQMCEKMIG